VSAVRAATPCYTPGMRSALAALVLALTVVASVPAQAQAQGEDGTSDQMEGGRSGFWTSRAPAKGGAYRWRLLGIGVGLLAVTGFVMLRLVKKANNDRDRRK